jgi:hypothetical protein
MSASHLGLICRSQDQLRDRVVNQRSNTDVTTDDHSPQDTVPLGSLPHRESVHSQSINPNYVLLVRSVRAGAVFSDRFPKAA